MATNPFSIDAKDMLVTAGVGTFAATSGWSIHISKEPDGSPFPNTTITIYDTGGPGPNPKWLLEEVSIQVRIRGDVNGFQNAWIKAQAIKDALLGKDPSTVNTTRYTGIYMDGDISFLMYDDSNRPIIALNFRTIREPASGTNRESL